jgi:hypothetical protein
VYLVLHLMSFKGGNVQCKKVDMITNHLPMPIPFQMICNVHNLNTIMDRYEPWLGVDVSIRVYKLHVMLTRNYIIMIMFNAH